MSLASIGTPARSATAPERAARTVRADRNAIRAVLWKDFTAIGRSKAVLLPMLIVPSVLLVLLPLVMTVIAVHTTPDVSGALRSLPGSMSRAIMARPASERAVLLVDGYLLAPLFLIVPLMISAVVAADSFAGEKERRTLESLLHLPISDRDLFVAKVIGAFVPSVLVSWVGFAVFVVVADITAWPVMHRVFLPTTLWMLMIAWVAPGVATLGLGVMVRVSARTRTTQEANQLGGAVVMPLIFLALGQAAGLLLVNPPVAVALGAVVWAIGLALVRGGARRFTRDRLAASA